VLGSGLHDGSMVKAPEELNRAVRTVIEATDPAVQPVRRLRRFVVKRIEVAGAPLVDELAKQSGRAASGLGIRKLPTKRQGSK
jgi:hypothetical protein